MANQPFTPEQTATHRRHFLRILSRKGNVMIAAAETGVSATWFYKQARDDPKFRQRWADAKALSARRLAGRPGARRTLGGIAARLEMMKGREMIVATGTDGAPKLRPKRDDEPGEEAIATFLTTLGDTGNVSLAARTAGFANSTLYALRARSPEFRRAMREVKESARDGLTLQATAMIGQLMEMKVAGKGNNRVDITVSEALEGMERVSASLRREREAEEATEARSLASTENQHAASSEEADRIATSEETDAWLREQLKQKFYALNKQRRHEAQQRRKANRERAQAKQVAKRRAAKKG